MLNFTKSRPKKCDDSEIDLLLQYSNDIIPIEIKTSENLNAKSLKVFCEKFTPQNAIRTSLSDYRKESWLTNVPLYAVGDYFLSPEQ